jgi:glyoxylase-like metal-dependent hydrolase (beta-lactamase superfamily II)
MIKAQSEIKKMFLLETKEIEENIYSIKDDIVNLYLVKDSTQFIAIDAGNNIETVAIEMEKLGIDPEQVSAVLLTHTDGDHTAALKLFKNAEVYLSKQEEKLLTGEEKRFLFFGNSIDAEEYTTIEDQQTFNIDNLKIKGILTPGHTFGSMCYLINDKYLFIGDAMSLKDGKMDKFNEFFNTDTETAIKSMKNITELPTAEYIFTAHYGYTDNYKKAVAGWGN